MARPLRIEFPGAIYHITSRGNAYQPIFMDDRDRKKFLEILSSAVERFTWVCHAYCLMGNHYHLVIETPEGNLSKGMRQLNGVYTQFFNYRHSRVGHLFQGRYKAILVDRDNYLLSLCRYVVLNPVRAGLVKDPLDWAWSSYKATVEGETQPQLSVDWILSQFGDRKKKAIPLYKKFVLDGISAECPWGALKGQIFLGTDDFVEEFGDLLKVRKDTKESPVAQRYANRPPLSEIFNKESRINRKIKDRAIYIAYADHSYTLSEIAKHLRVHYTTVSRAIKRFEENSGTML